MKTCLSIAGSDSSGGAGIQADLKTFAAHKVYGMSVITAITAQNTLGVSHVHSVPAATVEQQLNAVLSDIPPNAVKIGMLDNADIVTAVATQLRAYPASNVVLDPVLASSSGRPLLAENAIADLLEKLVPLVSVITPNVDELIRLLNFMGVNTTAIVNIDELENATAALAAELGKQVGYNAAILSKGGHLNGEPTDILFSDNKYHRLSGKRITSNNTHGTGCTLSAAITANLSLDQDLLEATANAKQYLTRAIAAQLNLGSGNGPLKHDI